MGDTLEIPHSFIGFAHSPAGVKPVKPGKSPRRMRNYAISKYGPNGAWKMESFDAVEID